MLGELLSMYMSGFTAFWRVAFGGGLFQIVLIGFLIWWFFCRREGRCCCDHCGCWCGRCQCAEVRIEHAEAEPVKKKRSSSSKAKSDS